MRLLILDAADEDDVEYDCAGFWEPTSVLDYDAVVWDPMQPLTPYIRASRRFANEAWFQGLPSLDEHQSAQVRSDLSRRGREFHDLVMSGRTLIVVSRPPVQFYYDTGQREFSGTGKNRAATIKVDKADMWQALPLRLQMRQASGTRMQYVGPDGPFASFWRSQQSHLRYEAILVEDYGTLLWRISGTDQVVGSVNYAQGGGQIVLIPTPIWIDEDEESSSVTTDDQNAFWTAIEELAHGLSRSTAGSALPQWSANYRTIGEEAVRQELQRLQEELDRLTEQLVDCRNTLEDKEALKVLFAGTGRRLEEQVAAVLSDLGGKVEEPPPGRDDWLVRFPEGTAVVEVKGVSSSAAEKHCAQLEKWVAGYREEHDETAKGILVVNAWREVPLADRSNSAFPDQMLPYAIARQHCLVTGIQLFNIAIAIENDPSVATEIRKSLLETTGSTVSLRIGVIT